MALRYVRKTYGLDLFPYIEQLNYKIKFMCNSKYKYDINYDIRIVESGLNIMLDLNDIFDYAEEKIKKYNNGEYEDRYKTIDKSNRYTYEEFDPNKENIHNFIENRSKSLIDRILGSKTAKYIDNFTDSKSLKGSDYYGFFVHFGDIKNPIVGKDISKTDALDFLKSCRSVEEGFPSKKDVEKFLHLFENIKPCRISVEHRYNYISSDEDFKFFKTLMILFSFYINNLLHNQFDDSDKYEGTYRRHFSNYISNHVFNYDNAYLHISKYDRTYLNYILDSIEECLNRLDNFITRKKDIKSFIRDYKEYLPDVSKKDYTRIIQCCNKYQETSINYNIYCCNKIEVKKHQKEDLLNMINLLEKETNFLQFKNDSK